MASNLNGTSSMPAAPATQQQQANNTPAEPSQTQTQIQTTAGEPASTQQKPMSYAEMFVAMNPYRPQTPEERAAEAKRNRRNAMFAAISDGISALSNLYYTTKGAPNSFNGGSTLSGKLYERQRQLMKDQEAREKDYLNGYMKALEMDRNRENTERNWRYKLERDAMTDKRNAAKDERDAALHELNMKLTQGKITEQEYKAESAKIESQYADELAKEKVKSQKALTNQRNASAAAAYARANGGGGSGSSSEKLWVYPIKGEDIELPKTFWSNSGEVNGLYSMLPKDVRDKIEHEYTPTGRVKKDIKPTLDQKRQAIMDNATPEIMVKLRAKSRSFGGTYSQSQETVPDDPYADYEISEPSNDENEELDFDSMRMN